MPDEDASTDVAPPPSRPSLKRRITRPSELIDLVAGTTVGEYQIEEQIGEGAMGTVYSAVHPLIGKKVAIKVLKAELCANQASIDRFVHEAQAVNKIGHPNIVDVFSLGELPDGRAYFVMEWLRGEDLKTRLSRGALATAEACDILDAIARALEAAHAKEIIHRDLKPDNVFLHEVEGGLLMVKLLDFGIAKLVKVTPGAEKTQTGNMLGTPRYISPEQARGVQVDHRSDIYSLGVMAYEMLSGHPPFDGETAMDLVVKHLSEPPPPLSQYVKLPRGLEQLVMAMLAKDPAARPRLDEVRAVLIEPSRRLTPSPTRLMTPVPGSITTYAAARRPTPRWPVAVALVGAVVVGLVAWKLVAGSKAGAPATSPAVEATSPAAVTPPAPAPAPAPPAPAPAVPARGTLEVDVQGATDSTIAIDGEERGRGASIKLELDAGEHEVVVKAPKRPAITKKVEINAGGVSSIAIVVPPAPRAGYRTRKPTPGRGGDDELLTPKRK